MENKNHLHPTYDLTIREEDFEKLWSPVICTVIKNK